MLHGLFGHGPSKSNPLSYCFHCERRVVMRVRTPTSWRSLTHDCQPVESKAFANSRAAAHGYWSGAYSRPMVKEQTEHLARGSQLHLLKKLCERKFRKRWRRMEFQMRRTTEPTEMGLTPRNGIPPSVLVFGRRLAFQWSRGSGQEPCLSCRHAPSDRAELNSAGGATREIQNSIKSSCLCLRSHDPFFWHPNTES